MSFEERLAARKAADVPSQDVEILLDDDLAARRESLQQMLSDAESGADERLTARNKQAEKIQAELDTLIAESADALTTLRFRRLPGADWANITSRCPVRVDAPIDVRYGYNVQSAVMLAAPKSGVLVEGDTERELTDDQWRDLFQVLSGHEFSLIVDAVFLVNEWEPSRRIAALKKALANNRTSAPN